MYPPFLWCFKGGLSLKTLRFACQFVCWQGIVLDFCLDSLDVFFFKKVQLVVCCLNKLHETISHSKLSRYVFFIWIFHYVCLHSPERCLPTSSRIFFGGVLLPIHKASKPIKGAEMLDLLLLSNPLFDWKFKMGRRCSLGGCKYFCDAQMTH